MPFDTSGVYTPPSGSEDAAAGQIIRSATWNSIFTDIAAALTQIGENSYVHTARYVSSGNFTVTTTDAVVVVQGSCPTITIPIASTRAGGFWILGGASSVFSAAPAILVRTSGDTISGQPTWTLNRDYQAVFLQPYSLGYIISGQTGASVVTSSTPVTVSGNYTVLAGDSGVIFNTGSTATVTLPTASTYPGRWLYIKNLQNQLIQATGTVVQPLAGPAGTLSPTICAGTAGKFVQLQSDGTNWVTMAGN